ncbi:putative metallo-beta-lactamase superfamily [Alicycliphilus sp. B1]|nr:putative metallo-beta-lactamase superfamily [Alicycliphilus sp. B1]
MKKEKSIARWTVSWRFGDGSTEAMPAADLEESLQRQYHAMASSDDPLLADAGRRRLREAAENAAAQQIADMQRADISKRPRSSKRGDLKEKIQAAMRVEKTRGTDFKTFMKCWSQEPQNGLRCEPEGEDYLIEDENDIDGHQRKYTWGTLQAYYSQS